MPDQKVSSQPEHTTAVLGADLLPLVANTDTTPTNFRVQVKNFLSQVVITLPQTTFSALKMTANAAANSNAAVQAAGEFNMVDETTGVNALDRYGLLGSNVVKNGNTVILGRFAGGMVTMDSGNCTTDASNTYGFIVRHFSNTAPRFTAPRAFYAVQEDANTGAFTSYLMDIGAGGKAVSADANANSAVVFSGLSADAPASHVLKVNVNGTDLWLLASNVAPV